VAGDQNHLDADVAAAARVALGRARAVVGAGRRARDMAAVEAARRRVDAVKVALGDRGPVWWEEEEEEMEEEEEGSVEGGTRGTGLTGGKRRDWNRCMVKNAPYAGW